MHSKLYFLTLMTFVWISCIPQSELVDCLENPNSPVCLDNTKSSSPASLYVAPPFGLSFTCVLLECEQTLTLKVENRGGGSIALSDIELRNNATDAPLDFSFQVSNHEQYDSQDPSLTPARDGSVAARTDSPIYIHVTYKPQDGINDSATLRLEWFDGRDEFVDAEINRVELPIAARVLEAAEASLETASLDFGFIATGNSNTKVARLTNISRNDAVLGVLDIQLTPETSSAFQIGVGWTSFVNPNDEIQIPITFRPTQDTLSYGTLQILTNASTEPYEVTLSGTSISNSEIRLEPRLDESIDFGTIRANEASTREITLINAGGTNGEFRVSIEGADGVFSTDLTEDPTALNSMASKTFNVIASPTRGGDLEATLILDMDNGQEPIRVGLRGFCSAPRIKAPQLVTLASIVQSWTSDASLIDISNNGVGDLIISEISFELGSSDQIRLGDFLPLPATLSPSDPPLQIPVIMTANNLGPANARMLISHNGMDGPIRQVEISSEVLKCEEGCPIENGYPNCMSGECDIDSCHSGWHDQNENAADGCECGEERGGNDIGKVCSSGVNLGTLGDCGSDYPSQKMQSGTLHHESDIDLFFFSSDDAGDIGCEAFNDSSRTSVELMDAPEGLVLCAIIRDRDTGCGGYTHYFDPNICGETSYSWDGSWFSNDSRDLTAWVLWHPDASPSCGTYTLKFRGEE